MTAIRVEQDLSVTLLVHRLATHQLIEWPIKLQPSAPPLAISELRVDDDGKYVVFQSEERICSIDRGTRPFIYALDFRDPTPVRRFLGSGCHPEISADGGQIEFERVVDGVPATVSVGTDSWHLQILPESTRRMTSASNVEASGRSPRRELIVPLLPVDDSIQEELVLSNPNARETTVTARLQLGYLTWKRVFTLPANGTLTVDPAEIRRGRDAVLVDLFASLPITAEYRVEGCSVPFLDPGTVASRLAFFSPAASRLVLANISEKPTRLKVAVLDGRGFAEASAQILTVRPWDLSLVDLAPLGSGQVLVETLDRGQVAGALIVLD